MALSAGRVGVNPTDVNPMNGRLQSAIYSPSDTIIGVTSEGYTVHRKMIKFTTPSVKGQMVKVSEEIDTSMKILEFNGIVHSEGNAFPINFFSTGTSYISTYIEEDGLYMKVGSDIDGANKNAYVTVIYFKEDN